ncbi:MAG: tetratricopeptide repeat protein [Bacteroidota bacterium]
MKKIILTGLIIVFVQSIFGQNYHNEFKKYCKTKDTLSQRQLLRKWEEEKPNEAELYTSYFNYYFSQSFREVVSISPNPDKDGNFQITDSLNNIKGYINSSTRIIEDYQKKGLEYIDEGIKEYPTRLDMRFGKIYSLGQYKDWNNFTNEILKTIDYSNVINNQWTWTYNESVEDSKNFFLSGIQDYVLQLYETGDDDLLKNMREISQKVLEYYPNHVESLSNISITYLLTREYDKGIEVLLKAEKINPKDYIVLSNIAHAYKLQGDKEMSIDYYEKTMKYGDDQAKEFARKQIEELGN